MWPDFTNVWMVVMKIIRVVADVGYPCFPDSFDPIDQSRIVYWCLISPVLSL